MSKGVKFLIGLAAALLVGWLYHGPLGHGTALIDRLGREASAAVAATEVPGVAVALGRDPLTRAVTLSGDADPFQREGQGEYPGITERVTTIEGISSVRWTDEPAGEGLVLPLLAEGLAMIALGFLAGFAVAWLLFGRPKREGYL